MHSFWPHINFHRNLFRGPVYKEHCPMYSSVILCKSLKIFFLVCDFLYCSLSAENLKTNHNSEKVFFFLIGNWVTWFESVAYWVFNFIPSPSFLGHSEGLFQESHETASPLWLIFKEDFIKCKIVIHYYLYLVKLKRQYSLELEMGFLVFQNKHPWKIF